MVIPSLCDYPELENQEQIPVTRCLFPRQEGLGAETPLARGGAPPSLKLMLTGTMDFSLPQLCLLHPPTLVMIYLRNKPELGASGIWGSLLPHPVLTSPDGAGKAM